MVCSVGFVAASARRPTVIFDARVTGGMLTAAGQPLASVVNGAALGSWQSNVRGIALVNNGCAVTYSDGVNDPVYGGANGRPSVTVSGSGANRFAWPAMPSVGNRTLAWVGATDIGGDMFGQKESDGNQRHRFSLLRDGNSYWNFIVNAVDPQGVLKTVTVKPFTFHASVIPATLLFVLSVTNLPGGSMLARVASFRYTGIVPLTTASASVSSAATTDFRFNLGGGRTWIHEMRLYDAALSDADLLGVRDELFAKWGFV